MENIELNKILNREENANLIRNILTEFEQNKNNLLFKKGIYIYGDPGSGKSAFISNILKEMNYDIIKYDAGDIRNKAIIETITKHNMSDKNILSMFKNKIKKIAIIMDEIDGMNNGDKGGINSLIKLIRPKKTKKQKEEEITMNPIICIGNYHMDKKIKELMKVCNTIELKTPTNSQISLIINKLLPNLDENVKEKLVVFVQGDLRKLSNMHNIYLKDPTIFQSDTIKNIFQLKSYNDDTKKITEKLLNNYFPSNEHLTIMNETDRTIVGLLWHENIIDVIEKVDKKLSVPFYLNQLKNMCFADYIDRTTFQKQIWQFNEMSSLIKTFKNNKAFHDSKEAMFKGKEMPKLKEIRFTKVLTKYSTEYNNSIFIQKMCQELAMDKKDLISFFVELKEKNDEAQILAMFENYDISKLDINRIYRYIEKYIKEDAAGEDEKEIDEYDLGLNEEINDEIF
jgi:hypothetical protein